MTITLDWLGTATFRMRIGPLTLFLDAYMDRVAAAPPVGLGTKDITEADFVLVGHSHFDHLAGAEVIAANTGARIIGSNETCRVMRERGISGKQLLPSQGGERHDLGHGVTVRVVPSIHACTWVLTDAGAGQEEYGHTDLTQDERLSCAGLTQRIQAKIRDHPDGAALLDHIRSAAGSLNDGGPLAYVITTPDGTIFYQDTSGSWTGVLRDLRADVAILAASGRANVDGEPVQGSMAGFLAMEAEMLGARTVVLGHHDDWMPPVTVANFDIAAVRTELANRAPAAKLVEMGYLEGVPLLG